MSIVTFQIKRGSPTSCRVKQRNVMAEKPETGELKYISYYRGQNSIFDEDIKNKDIKPSKVPDFTLNPTRNKCELRFDDRDTALFKYLTTHPYNNKKWELYSEEIENERKLGKAEKIEKALDYIKESDDLKIRALGLAVLGINTYGKSALSIKALLKDKAINSPKDVISACEDDLFENKFITALALSSGIIKTNSTMTAIVWGDNNGRIFNIATGEDFITKFAKNLSDKSPENRALLQEIGNRLELTKKEKTAKSKEADEIAKLKAQLEAYKTDLEIAKGKVAKIEVKEDSKEPSLEELAKMELREKYTSLLGKNVPIRYMNDIEWIEAKINEAEG